MKAPCFILLELGKTLRGMSNVCDPHGVLFTDDGKIARSQLVAAHGHK